MSRNALGFDDSGSESEELEPSSSFKPGKVSQKKNDFLAQSVKFKQQQRTKVELDETDQEIYQYDELYDEIKNRRESKLLGGKKISTSGPKYMNSLIEAKNKRLQDKEIIQDLKFQRERLLEGDKFKDKEIFITDSYKEHKEKLRNDAKAENDNGEEETVTDMKEFHRAFLNDDLGTTSSPISELQSSAEPEKEFIKNYEKPVKFVKDVQSSRNRETAHVLKLLEEEQTRKEQAKPFKSRLLPRLSDSDIEAAKERYILRIRASGSHQ